MGGSRVAWHEGLFLRPQHFQQQDRFTESLVNARADGLTSYPWGVRTLVIDETLAQLGKFGVTSLTAVLRDGAPISIPGDLPPPSPIDLPSDLRDAVIYVTLPPAQAGALEFQPRDRVVPSTRFAVDEEELYDASAEERSGEGVELARPNLSFGHAPKETEGRVVLALARVREVLNGRVIFDENFIPPTLNANAAPCLPGFLTDVIGRANQRIDELAHRAVEATDGGAETFASFLLLLSLNKWTPQLTHLASLPNLHPERLYEAFVGMAGELSTLTLSERRPPDFPPYDHDNLQMTFAPVHAALQRSLSAMFERSAGQLPLEAVGPGAYTALVQDRSLFETANFYLAVSARTPPEMIQQRFGSLVKVGSVLRMRDIVANALQAGVRISQTPTPPAQIRIVPGYTYFELDRSSPDWPDLASAPSIGLHVSGDWPELKLELWWVKRVRR